MAIVDAFQLSKAPQGKPCRLVMISITDFNPPGPMADIGRFVQIKAQFSDWPDLIDYLVPEAEGSLSRGQVAMVLRNFADSIETGPPDGR